MSIFKLITGESVEEAKKKENELLQRKLQRKFASAYDSAENIIFEAEQAIDNARKDFGNFNVNTILEKKRALVKAKELQGQLKDEYKDYFGVDMKVAG